MDNRKVPSSGILLHVVTILTRNLLSMSSICTVARCARCNCCNIIRIIRHFKTRAIRSSTNRNYPFDLPMVKRSTKTRKKRAEEVL